MILAPLLAALIQAAVSRQREYLADATGALTTRHPEALASALQKLGGIRQTTEETAGVDGSLVDGGPHPARCYRPDVPNSPTHSRPCSALVGEQSTLLGVWRWHGA